MSLYQNKKYLISNTYDQNNDFKHLSFTEKQDLKDIKIKTFSVCIDGAVIFTSKTFLGVNKWVYFTTTV